jgi:hypothetical protein
VYDFLEPRCPHIRTLGQLVEVEVFLEPRCPHIRTLGQLVEVAHFLEPKGAHIRTYEKVDGAPFFRAKMPTY